MARGSRRVPAPFAGGESSESLWNLLSVFEVIEPSHIDRVRVLLLSFQLASSPRRLDLTLCSHWYQTSAFIYMAFEHLFKPPSIYKTIPDGFRWPLFLNVPHNVFLLPWLFWGLQSVSCTSIYNLLTALYPASIMNSSLLFFSIPFLELCFCKSKISRSCRYALVALLLFPKMRETLQFQEEIEEVPQRHISTLFTSQTLQKLAKTSRQCQAAPTEVRWFSPRSGLTPLNRVQSTFIFFERNKCFYRLEVEYQGRNKRSREMSSGIVRRAVKENIIKNSTYRAIKENIIKNSIYRAIMDHRRLEYLERICNSLRTAICVRLKPILCQCSAYDSYYHTGLFASISIPRPTVKIEKLSTICGVPFQ